MNISDINPHIRYAKRHTVPEQRQTFSRCYDCRLFFFETAEGTMEIEGKKYNVSNNTAIYLPPASRYRFSFPRDLPYRVMVFNFDPGQQCAHIAECLHTATDGSFDPAQVPAYSLPDALSAPIIRDGMTGSALLARGIEEFLTRRNLYRESASACLKSFLIDLLREQSAGGHSALVEEVIRFIKQNYSDPALTNAVIASHFGYHPYHLSKLIKAATGLPLKQYLQDYRVRIAKQYLATTDLAMEMIAFRSGFGSSAYFIKVFREITGVTPRRYRVSSGGGVI